MRTDQPLLDKEEKETWPDGHVTWVTTTKLPLYNDQGEIVGTFGISRDITEQKQAAEALRNSEMKYRTLYDSSRDAIMLVTPQEGFLSGNPAAIELFGCKDEEEFTTHTPVDFSPDGTQLAFFSGSELWVQKVYERQLQQLTNEFYTSLESLTWTADGQEVIFAASKADFSLMGPVSGLWISTANSGKPPRERPISTNRESLECRVVTAFR